MLLTQIGNGVSTTTTPLCGRMPQIIESISEGPLFAISAVNVESLIVRVTLSLSPRLAFLFTSKDSLPSMLAFAFSHCTVTLAIPIFGFFDVHLRVFASGSITWLYRRIGVKYHCRTRVGDAAKLPRVIQCNTDIRGCFQMEADPRE